MEATEEQRRAAEMKLLERLLERLEAQSSTSPEVLQAIRHEVSAGITQGITAALTPENAERFWGAAVTAMQAAATKKAGTFLLAGLSEGMKKLMWAVVFVLAAWSWLGWSGMSAVWTAIKASR